MKSIFHHVWDLSSRNI